MHNINDILSAITSKDGILQSAHFYAVLTPNQSLQKELGGISDFRLFCTSATLPGLQFSTTDIKPYNYGFSEKRPIEGATPDMTLEFLVDARGEIPNTFYKWLQNIQNVNSQTRFGSQYNKMRLFEFQYPEKYEGVLDIYHYDQSANPILHYQLYGVFPININEMAVDWGAMDQPLKMSITFAYNYWVTDVFDNGKDDPTSLSTPSTLTNKDVSKGVTGTNNIALNGNLSNNIG